MFPSMLQDCQTLSGSLPVVDNCFGGNKITILERRLYDPNIVEYCILALDLSNPVLTGDGA